MRSGKGLLWLVLAASWFGGLGYLDLTHPDEGRYSEISREMASTGDWVTPRLNGLKYFEKPPLQYWATALLFRAFGESEFVARLWVGLCGFATVILVYSTALRLWGGRTADFAALTCASMMWIVGLSHIVTLDMGVNILFVLFVGNLFGILVASNIGYVLANTFAIAAFVLLRKDRPNWPRPIKLPSIWVPIAVVLCAAFVLFSIVGIGWFQIAGGGAVYGGTKEKIIGFSVLAISLVLFLFRRIVQDKETPHWREETPQMPDEVPAPEAPVVTVT